MTEPLSPGPAVSRKQQSIINLICIYFTIVLTIVQGIILTPVYIKFIPKSLYGAWLATGDMVGWISMIDPGISRIMQQRTAFAFGRREMDRLGGVLGTGLFLGFFFSVLPLLAIPFSGRIIGTLDVSALEHEQLTVAFEWALVATGLMIATFQPAAANLGLQRGLGAGISYAIATISGIACTYIMLQMGYGLLSIPVGLTIRAGIMLLANGAWMWHWCHQNLRGRIAVRSDEFRSYAVLSTLTFFERMVSTLLSRSDSFLIALIYGNSQVPIYAFTGRALEPVRMAAERLMPAFLPGLAHLQGEGNDARSSEISHRLLGLVSFVLSVGAACVVALNFAFVKIWIGGEFFGGQRLTLIFACFVVTNVIFTCLAETVFALGGVGQIEIMRVIEGILRIALQLLLLKYMGLIGIPIGGCIGVLLVSGVYLPGLAARKLGGSARAQYIATAFNFLRAAILLACGGAAWYILDRIVTNWNLLKFLAAGAVAGTLFSSIGLALSPSTRDELRRLFKRLKARSAPKPAEPVAVTATEQHS